MKPERIQPPTPTLLAYTGKLGPETTISLRGGRGLGIRAGTARELPAADAADLLRLGVPGAWALCGRVLPGLELAGLRTAHLMREGSEPELVVVLDAAAAAALHASLARAIASQPVEPGSSEPPAAGVEPDPSQPEMPVAQPAERKARKGEG